MTAGRLLPPRAFDGIPGRVHRNDVMLWPPTSDVLSFYRDGAQHVITSIERALQHGGRDVDSVSRWLDFGCGYGRVLRYLTRTVEPSRVWATDVIPDAVRFCAREFGVHPVESNKAMATLDMGTFDFVYAISVLTHLNAADSSEFLRLMGRTLNGAGLVLFTTQGECTAENLRDAGLPQSIVQQGLAIADEFAHRGLSYRPYGYYSRDYGVTFHSRAWIERTVHAVHGNALELVAFEPGAMPFAQDTYVYRRRG